MQRRLFRICACPIEGGVCDPRIVPIEITLWLLLAGLAMSLSGCGGSLHRPYYYEDDQHFRYYETTSGDVLLVSPGGQVVDATPVVKETGYPSIVKTRDGDLVGNEGHRPEPPNRQIRGVSEVYWFPWSIREDGYVAWNYGLKPEPPAPNISKAKWFPWGNWPLSPPTSEPAAEIPEPNSEPQGRSLPVVGTTTWKSELADWDMASYEIAPETGACKPFALSVTLHAAYPTPYDPFFKKRSCWHVLWDVPASLLGDAFVASLIAAKIGLQLGLLR